MEERKLKLFLLAWVSNLGKFKRYHIASTIYLKFLFYDLFIGFSSKSIFNKATRRLLIEVFDSCNGGSTQLRNIDS